MTEAKKTLGLGIADRDLIVTVRQICDEKGLSYRAFTEATVREVLANPDHFDHMVNEARKIMSGTGEIGRLRTENLVLRQRIAELEKLHQSSIQIQQPHGYRSGIDVSVR